MILLNHKATVDEDQFAKESYWTGKQSSAPPINRVCIYSYMHTHTDVKGHPIQLSSTQHLCASTPLRKPS